MERSFNTPMDMYALTASNRSVGYIVKNIEEISNGVAGFDPACVMDALSFALDFVSDAGHDLAKHAEIAKYLPGEQRVLALQWLNKVGTPRIRVLFNERAVATVGVLALSGSSRGGRQDTDALFKFILSYSLGVMDHIEVAESQIVMDLMLSAISEDPSWVVNAREAYEFAEIANSDDVIGMAFSGLHSVSLLDAWLTTFVVGMQIFLNDSQGNRFWPTEMPEELLGGVSPGTLLMTRGLWEMSLDECILKSKFDVTRLGWSFTSLGDRPIISEGGTSWIPWRRGLRLKSSQFGLFSLVQRAESEGLTMSQIRTSCGRMLERRVEDLLEVYYPHLLSIYGEQAQANLFETSGSRCDWLLEEKGFIVAMEGRHRPLSYNSQTSGSSRDVEKDLKVSIIEKISQADKSLYNAKASGMLGAKTPVCIIVNSCPQPRGLFLTDYIDGATADLPFRKERAYTIALLTTADLNSLLSYCRRKKRSLGAVVEEWRTDLVFGNFDAQSWLSEKDKNHVENHAEWVGRILDYTLGV